MRKRVIFIFVLFSTLMGFNVENRVVEQNGISYQENSSALGKSVAILQPLPDKMMVNEGADAILSVAFSKSGGVKWYKNGTQLTHGEKFRIIANGLISTLVIKNVKSEDAGTYTAQLEGMKTSTKLFVILPDQGE